MTITLPEPLEREIKQRAELLQVSVERLLQDAVGWYLNVDAELQAELEAWEKGSAESLTAFEDSLQ